MNTDDSMLKTQPKTQYVCGFMFDHEAKHVAVIRKERPAWQRGKFNGIGGKVEPNEMPRAAMIREFAEETGCFLDVSWECFCRLEGENCIVHFYTAKAYFPFSELASTTDEIVKILHVDDHCLVHPATSLPNLKWLVPMARESLATKIFARVGEGRNDGLDENGRDR